MTDEDGAGCIGCIACFSFLTLVSGIITYWHIASIILLIIGIVILICLGIYLIVKIKNKRKARKIAKRYNEYWNERKRALVAEQSKKTAEFYEEKCSYCGEIIPKNQNTCEYCGYDKRPIEVIEKRRRNISTQVKREVWRRDEGKCVECGSKERLEYDHIIPFSRGGSNTTRNIQLLCEDCNRKKSSNIE